MHSGDRVQVRRSCVDQGVIVGVFPTRPVLMQRSLDAPGRFVFCAATNRLALDGQVLSGTRQEVLTLAVLLCAGGSLISHDDLFAALWGDREDGGPEGTARLILVRISQARKIAASVGVRIVNRWGFGWSAINAAARPQAAE